jgi:hypothetical protein
MGLPSDGHFVSGRAWYFSILGSRWGDRGFEGLPPFTPGNAEVKSIFTCLYRFGSVLFGRFCIKIFYETHFDTPGTSKPPNPTASNPKTLNPGAQHQGRGPGFGVEGRAFGLTPPPEATHCRAHGGSRWDERFCVTSIRAGVHGSRGGCVWLTQRLLQTFSGESQETSMCGRFSHPFYHNSYDWVVRLT